MSAGVRMRTKNNIKIKFRKEIKIMNYIPGIIKETSNGYFSLSLMDELMSNREIYCLGEINQESAGALILQLKYLERQDSEKEITMYISSPGGEVASGLAIYDIMHSIKCPIRTVCMGTAASFGAVLFAAGQRREMLPHSRLMIHNPLIAGNGITGSATSLAERVGDLMKNRKILGTLLAQNTGKTIDQIYSKTAKDTWFTAEEAVDFGLADSIIQLEQGKEKDLLTEQENLSQETESELPFE